MTGEDFRAEELRQFFCAVGELREALRDEQPADLVDYHLNEIEGIAINTEQAILRQRCLETLAQHRVSRYGTSA